MSSLTKFLREYQDPIMTLLIFLGYLSYIEVEYYFNTGHVVTHWTVLQGPAMVAVLFYLLKCAAVLFGNMVREDRESRKEYESDA